MLRNASTIYGYAAAASDGRLGTVSDFLFDDARWLVRWFVVDTGNISPRSARTIDWTDRLVNLDVDRQRVKDSPAYDPSITVDPDYDENVLTYYGIRFVAK